MLPGAAVAEPQATPPAGSCRNCGAAAEQRFCPACGQATGHALQRPFREILGEVLEETISLDSRFVHTFGPLLFRPGFLAVEYLAGRKARYTSPLKLYLLFSFVFFVAAALTPEPSVRVAAQGGTEEERAEARREIDADLAKLRATGRVGARVVDRLEELQALPRARAQARVSAAIQENAPRVVFFLVPVLALLLKLAYRRRYYAEQLVTALHAHAVGFAALLPGEVLGLQAVTRVGVLAAALWALLAMRRVYGEGWGRTAAKGLFVLVAYAAALGLSLVAALAVGLLL